MQLPCNLSLSARFTDINVSQVSVATYASCKFTKESSSEICLKSVKIWQNYGHESMAHWPRLFVPPCSFILDVRTSENEKEAWRMLIFHDATNTQVAYCLIMHDVTVIERINWSLTEGAGVVVCVKQGADLHMAQPMPLPLILSSSAKSILVLPFWYRLNLKILIHKAREHQQPLYMCFVDFKKAFDSISHDKLWVTMMDMGYPLHLIDLLAKLYRKQRAKVKVAGTLSEWFSVKKGVRQGSVLSPYLFNILTEMVMRETLDRFQGGVQIGGRMITNLRYTDDIILLATSEAERQLVDRLDRVSRKYSLLINVDKTKVMASDGIACRILIQNELLEQMHTVPSRTVGPRLQKMASVRRNSVPG